MKEDDIIGCPLLTRYYSYIYDKIEVSSQERIAFDILSDIRDRRGLKSEWNSIDDDIQEEILKTWIKIVDGRKTTE